MKMELFEDRSIKGAVIPTRNWLDKPPLKPSIQLKAFATPTTQNIVKIGPITLFKVISPKPKRFPREVRLKSETPITIPEHKIKVINLNQTGSSKMSSKNETAETINPVIPNNNPVLISRFHDESFKVSVSKKISKNCE